MTDITVIEGIGPAIADKLEKANVTSCEALLEKGASASGRSQIADASGVSTSQVLKFVNHADLCRIKGVGGEYAELLEATGVDSVPELAHRNADNLATAMGSLNEEKKLVRQVPSAKTVSGWVEQAKSLPKVVTH